jgi:hypothetical protein
MKNKLFLSLALIIAANTFITTPAIAYNWTDAITIKTALKVSAIGSSLLIGAWAFKKRESLWSSIGNKINLRDINPKLVGLAALSIFSVCVGYKILKSTMNNIDKPKQKLLINYNNNPLITHFEWGQVKVNHNGIVEQFKDCKISPNGPQHWNWKQCGTQHDPGITIKALDSIIDDCDTIILSRGVDLVLQIPQGTIDHIKKQGKKVETLQSEEAYKRYNQLVNEREKVGILLHSTC